MLKKAIDKEVERILEGNEMSWGLIERLVSEVMTDFVKQKQIFRILSSKFNDLSYLSFKLF